MLGLIHVNKKLQLRKKGKGEEKMNIMKFILSVMMKILMGKKYEKKSR